MSSKKKIYKFEKSMNNKLVSKGKNTFFKLLPCLLGFVSSASLSLARLAQSVEHQTFNLRVKGSSPLSGLNF